MKRTLLVSIFCLLIAFPMTASAQFSTPLVITINGDFWTWYGDASLPPVSITQWGYNEPGVLSPDGGRIAYNSMAQIVVDALNRVGPIGSGALPSNIWVADPISGSGTRVGEQPPDASFFTEGVADKGIARSTPAWSPDGGRLAWAEQSYPDTIGSIVVYDFASGASIIVATNLPPSAGVPAPKEVLWGQNGIVVRDIQGNGDNFTVYQPTGEVSASFTVGGGGRALAYYALMEADGREMLGVLFNDSVWELFDLASGASQVALGIPELYSLRAGGSSLALSPTVNDTGGFTWRLLDPSGSIVAEFVSATYFIPQRYALSPDGQAAAFSDYLEDQRVFADVVNVWQNGSITVLPNPVGFPLVGAVLWSPLGWRVRAGVG